MINQISFKKGIQEFIELENTPSPILPISLLNAIGVKEISNDLLTYDNLSEILLKLKKYENNCFIYANNVITNFPQLDDNAKKNISNQSKEWVELIHPYTEKVENYLNSLYISPLETKDEDISIDN